jgi:hypothetical protein
MASERLAGITDDRVTKAAEITIGAKATNGKFCLLRVK